MTIELTDAQVARVLELCGKIAAVRNELPVAPFRLENAELEIAKYLRSSLLAKNDLLLELGALLR